MANWSRKKYFRLAKGYYRRSNNVFTVATRRVTKALQYAYKGRKMRRRIVRREWIQTVNAGVREHGVNYSNFVYGLNRSNLRLDRKILADLCVNEPYSFKAVVEEVKDQVSLKQKTPKMPLEEAFEKEMLVFEEQGRDSKADIPFKYMRYASDDVPDFAG